MKNIGKYILCGLVLAIYGCTSNKINPDVHYVYMSTDRAPINCKFVGIILGLHETFTSGANEKLGKNLAELHINQAKILGANYVEMNHTLDGGKGYICPESDLDKMVPYK